MLRMKKTIILFALNIVCLIGLAQSNIRLNNYWENTYYINPASINALHLGEVSMAGQKQWLNLPGSPTTFFATGTTYLDKLKTQFGLKVYQDKIGFTSTSDISLSYAYAVTLNREWRLNLGLAVSYQMLSYDLTEVNLENGTDTKFYDKLLSENNFNADLGFEFLYKKWKFGGASQNIFSLFSDINKQYANTNFLYTMYRQNSTELLNLVVGVCGIQYANYYQMEVSVANYFKLSENNDQFHIGVFYKTMNQMGAILGFNLSNNINVSYNYGFLLGGLSRSSIGSHELIISYQFDKPDKCYNCYY